MRPGVVMDAARPLLSCECVECDRHRGERDALHARVAEVEADALKAITRQIALVKERDGLRLRVAELEYEDQIKTDADALCARAAEAEIDRLRARVAALEAQRVFLMAQGDAMAQKRDALWDEVEHLREQNLRAKATIATLTAALAARSASSATPRGIHAAQNCPQCGRPMDATISGWRCASCGHWEAVRLAAAPHPEIR
jgi:phage I-like protein